MNQNLRSLDISRALETGSLLELIVSASWEFSSFIKDEKERGKGG